MTTLNSLYQQVSAEKLAELVHTDGLYRVGRYKMAVSTDSESRIIIVRRSKPECRGKYVRVLNEDGFVYLAAMPFGLIGFHREICQIIVHKSDKQCYCTGGGHYEIKGSDISLFGESEDFGPENHAEHLPHFAKLLTSISS